MRKFVSDREKCEKGADFCQQVPDENVKNMLGK